MKISNRTKDKFRVLGFLAFVFLVMFLIVYLFIAVVELFATTEIAYTENLTEKQQIYKFMAEETIKDEMEFLSAWEVIENMSDEEYFETFFKGEEYGLQM